MAEETFAKPAAKLAESGIRNTVVPAAGMGLTLTTKGRIPASVLLPVYSTWPTGTPDPNEEFIYEADATNGVYWHFKNVASQATYDWVFIGGPPLYSEVLTDESTTSTTYAVLTTAGPSIALPRAGDYYVTIGSGIYESTTGGVAALMSYDIGGTAAVDADSIRLVPTTTASVPIVDGVSRTRRKTGLTAVTLTAKYRSASGLNTVRFFDRWMSVLPIRLS